MPFLGNIQGPTKEGLIQRHSAELLAAGVDKSDLEFDIAIGEQASLRGEVEPVKIDASGQPFFQVQAGTATISFPTGLCLHGKILVETANGLAKAKEKNGRFVIQKR